MPIAAASRSFSSGETAKRFLDDVDLGTPIDHPVTGLIRHPMGGLFSVSLDSVAKSSIDSMVAGINSGASGGGASKPSTTGSGTGSTTGSASTTTPTTPDGTTLAGAISLKDQIQQSFAIGNGIISFDQGVTADRKKAAINSTLLAQLYANQLYPDRTKSDYATNWYGAYFNTLTNIGWVIQGDSNVKTFQGTGQGTVDQSVLTLASALIGASGAAAIKAVLDSLKSLADNSPVITVFKETSQTNKVAQFSISLSSQDPTAGFSITGLEFDLEASVTETQVLFFKWNTEKVTFNWRNLQLAVDDDVYTQIAADVAQKVTPFVANFVKEILLTPPS